MTILELKCDYETGPDKCPHVHLSIDDKEYLVIGSTGRVNSVTVVAGREWINSRRAMGKTFWSREQLRGHYKRHGEVLAEYADKVMGGKWVAK